ncbi:MAG: hypothetical protein RI973_270 [Bacteroidota bacterium]
MKISWYLLLASALMPLISCGDQAPGESESAELSKDSYNEPHRPQLHFSPPKMWMNDPNGMVYFEGEYHLFYQHYPDSNVWGPMHWGHAVSKDMVHWEHLPIALYPDSLGYIFSGSAVVDWENSSGFGKDGQPPLVAIFTHHDMAAEKAGRSDYQYQSIAWSNDRGRTWTKYEGNPVLKNPGDTRDFRDPKVFWHEESSKWVMTLAVKDHVRFYSSPDLKSWTFLSEFGRKHGTHAGVWECPDLFPMMANDKEKKWVLLVSINPGGPNGGSATQYFVGQFDGKNFTVDPAFAKDVENEMAVWLDYGRDNYAGVTWSDIPREDGRRLIIGWMSNWDYSQVVPTQAWRSAMTLPRSLYLGASGQGLRLFSRPVAELESLQRLSYSLDARPLSGEFDLTGSLEFSPDLMEVLLEVDFPEGTAADFGLTLSNAAGEEYSIGYDASKVGFYSDRTRAGAADFSGKFAAQRHLAPRVNPASRLRFHLFIDRASCELFADWGTTVMTECFFPSVPFDRVKIYSKNGEVQIVSGQFHQLQSIWQ